MSETDRLQEKQKLPIGFMDSGLGGLSVLREAIKLMPKEDFIYYGDSLHAPYGVKPQAEIRDLTFAVVEKLLDMGIKGLAVACNTATSAAVRLLRNTYGASNRGNRTSRETSRDGKSWRQNLSDGNPDDTQTGEVSEPFGKVSGAGRYRSSPV